MIKSLGCYKKKQPFVMKKKKRFDFNTYWEPIRWTKMNSCQISGANSTMAFRFTVRITVVPI